MGGQPPGPAVDDVVLSPSLLYAQETAVLEVNGTFSDDTSIDWSAAGAEIVGAGRRVNIVAPDAATTIDVAVTATDTNGSDGGSLMVDVLPPRPRIVIDSVSVSEVINEVLTEYTISGHAVNPPNEPLRVGAYVHSDVFYDTAVDASVTADAFSFDVTVHRQVDRITLMLFDAAYDSSAACAPCAGTFDDATGYRVPVASDGSDVHAFTSHYYLDGQHADPQIANLLGRMSRIDVAGTASPAAFIRSYLDRDQFYLYDQALAVIALSVAGEQEAAERVIAALANTQLAGGGWYFSYGADGSSDYPAEGDRQVSGAIAWVAIALNTYHHRFSSGVYHAMAAMTLAHLDATRFATSYLGDSYQPVAFGPTDLSATSWNEAGVAALEHNLDAYAAFRDYAVLASSSAHATVADELRSLAEVLFEGDRFYAGIDETGSVNATEIYLDPQSWGVLALSPTGSKGQDFAKGLEFNCREFVETAGYMNHQEAGVAGFFDVFVATVPKNRFVWTEGTLGMVLALQLARMAECDDRAPAAYLAAVAGLADATGVPYATATTNTDFTTSSSVAGTAWLYFANQGYNPFTPLEQSR